MWTPNFGLGLSITARLSFMYILRVSRLRKNPIFKKAGHNPSAGFVAVVLLLHKCSQVKLYGFHVLAGVRSSPNIMSARSPSQPASARFLFCCAPCLT